MSRPNYRSENLRRTHVVAVRTLLYGLAMWVALSATAQTTVYWDTNSTTAGASGSTTATGTWAGASNNNWSLSDVGTGATNNWNSIAGGNKIAVFSAGTNATGAFTVTVSGTVSNIIGLTFEEGSVTLSGGTALSLSANSVFNVASGATGSISTAITGAFSVDKTGDGNLTFTGAKAFTGGLSVSAGTLRAEGSSTGTLGNGTLTLAGGTLDLAHTAGVNYARATTVTADSTILSNRSANGAGVTYTLGTLLIGDQTLTVNAGSAVTSGTAGMTFGATTFAGDSTLSVGTGAQLTLGAINTNSAARDLTKSGAGLLILGSASGTITAGSSFTIAGGTMRVTNASALGSNVTHLMLKPTAAGGSAAFQIQGNGVSPNVSALTFGGTGTGAGATFSISTPSGNTSTGLTLSGGVTYDAANNPGAATISSRIFLGTSNRTFSIADSNATDAELSASGIISGTGGIIKTGAGTLALSGANSFTGALTISEGVLSIGAITNTSTAGALGQNNSVILDGGTLRYTGVTASSNRAFTLTNAKTSQLEVGAANAVLTISGATAATTGALNKTGAGTLVLTNNNQHSGGTIATAGTLRATTNANALGTGTLTLAGGTVQLANNTGLNFARNTAVTADSTLTSDRTSSGAGVTHTLGSLSIGNNTLTANTGSLVTSGTAGLTFGNTTLAGSSVFNVGSANTLLTLGELSIDATSSLTKSGSGTLTLGTATSNIVSGAAVTLQAGTLNSNNATALGSVAAVNVTGGTLNLGAAQTFGSLAGSGGTVNLNANTLTVGNSANNLSGTYIGTINGSGSLVKSGSGTLGLGGTNNYTGSTTVSQGTLQVNSNAPSGSAGALGNASSTVTLNDANTGANNTALLIGQSGVTVGRTVTVENHGSGTVSLGGNIASGTGTFGNTVTLNKNTTLTADGTSNITFSNSISGAGAVTKAGAGTVTLSNSNSYAGGTTLAAGTLALGHNSALGGGVLTISSGTLMASGGPRTIANDISAAGDFVIGGAEDLTINGAFILPGGSTRTLTVDNTATTTLTGGLDEQWYAHFIKAGNGRLVLTADGSISGLVTVADGTLALQHNTALGTATWGNVISSGATLELSNNITVAETGFDLSGTGHNSAGALHNLSGANTLDAQLLLQGATTIASTDGSLTLTNQMATNGHALTVSGDGAVAVTNQIYGGGSVIKEGEGTLTLSGPNSYSGATSITNGTLVAANNTALGTNAAGTTVADGATLALQGNITISDETISVTGTGHASGGALRNLSGANTVSQTVTLAGDATIAADAGTLTFANGLTGTNRDVTFNGSGDTILSGAMSLGTGSVTKNGSGVTTFMVGNTYSGGTTINDGALNIRHNSSLGSGAVTVNSGGTLEVQGGGVTTTNALTLDGGTLRNVSGDLNWMQGAVTLTDDSTIDSATANDRIYVGNTGNAITLGANTLTIDGPGKTIFVGAVGAAGEAGNIVINSTGDVWFNSQGLTNNYTGTTTVNRGNLYLGTNNHVSFNNTTIRGDLTIGNGDDAASVIYATGYGIEKIADTSHVTVNRYGTFDVNNSYDTIGALTLNGGAVALGTSGTLVLTGDVTVGDSDTTATISGYQFWLTPAAGDRIIAVADGDQTTDLLITAQVASGNLVKTGEGTLTLAGNNIYSGTTSVNTGVLNLRSNTSLGGATNGTTVASGAMLELQADPAYNSGNPLTIAAEALTLNSSGIGEAGALRNVAGNNIWGGAITLASESRINSDLDTLTINGSISGTNQNLIVGGAGDTWINGVIGTSAGTLTKDGTGTLTLTGNNNFAGATSIEAGVVNIRHSYGLGTTAGGVTVASDAALQLQADSNYNGGNPVSVGSGETLSLSGTGVGDTGALRNIAGNNTYGGAITVASSTVRINSDADTLALSNTVALGSNTLTAGGAGNTTITGQLTGTNSSVLNKDGAGTLTLSNSTNTFSGNVNVTDGTLAFGANNSLNNSAIDLNVGASGTVDLVSFAQSVGTIAGTGMIDFNSGGQLSLASTSTWSGQFDGSGTIIVGAGVTLTLASNIYAPNVNIILAGGTIIMDDGDHVFGNLTVTGTSTLSFTGDSTFEILNLFFDSLAHTLHVVNWVDTEDYFYSRDQPGVRHDPPLNQVVFTGWTGDNTTYLPDTQITPVPEPSTYGAMLMGAGLAFFGLRRWRRTRAAARK